MSSVTLRTRGAGPDAPRRPLGQVAPAPPAASPVAANLPSLRQLPFFAGVPDDTLVVLATRCRWQVYAPGEVVVDSGDPTDEVFFVAEGAVRVVVRTAHGYEAILNDLGAGSFFGELAAIDRTARSANVTALQRTRLCAIPGPAFMDVVLASPAAGLRLMRLMA
ncbi:MAG: cyclic nucleotide-binding domain-containing protein, partial [Acetobacteraceae bacterium]|nr:cyclic nucleotide-binding domain-containing protein [Acetobacteraceae bacterium]